MRSLNRKDRKRLILDILRCRATFPFYGFAVIDATFLFLKYRGADIQIPDVALIVFPFVMLPLALFCSERLVQRKWSVEKWSNVEFYTLGIAGTIWFAYLSAGTREYMVIPVLGMAAGLQILMGTATKVQISISWILFSVVFALRFRNQSMQDIGNDLTINFILAGAHYWWSIGSEYIRKQINTNKRLLALSREDTMVIRTERKNLASANSELSKTLDQLRAAQQQLVHQEKLASLGELTAGIAHEIKNPLNFINNFADLSNELLDELHTAEGEEKTETIDMLRLNLSKIHLHGKRADSIISNMMNHARGSTGERLLTDINTLVDESANLVYHGMRAQHPTFNVTIEKNLDSSIPEMKVMRQEISRVVINLVSNAMYAVQKKEETSTGSYQPTVTLSTIRAGKNIEIHVRDNGHGIPEEIRQKIFQPFFTTKPTGEGTGLGLSMSYDIIVNGHGGTLTCESNEEGAEFVVSLPM